MKDSIILIGGGGHCKSCIDVIEQYGKFHVAGIVDLAEKLHEKILGYEIFATDVDLSRLVNEYKNFFITIGQINSPDRRIALFNSLKSLGAVFPSIISPNAYVSKYTEIGEGTIIMHHSIINAGAKIGRNCIVNSKALLEHDVTIEDHCHISTGAIINGGTKISNGSFIGSKSVLKEYIKVGEGAIIGCGTRVLKSLPPNTVLKD